MAQLKKKTIAETYYHPRGWGGEHWVENLPEYCGKVLHITQGKRGSLHFHKNKLETMLLIQGKVLILLIDPETGKEYEVFLDVGDSIQIPRAQPHQIVGLEDSKIVEFSTIHEETDSYRIRKGD